MLKPDEITLELIRKTAQSLYDECKDEKLDREDIYDRVFEWTDSAWGDWIRYGRIDEYDVADLVATAPGCCRILELATERDCVAEDSGLWEELTYGVLAAIAFHSLEQLIRDLLCAIAQEAGVDLDDDEPFEIPPCEQPDQLHALTPGQRARLDAMVADRDSLDRDPETGKYPPRYWDLSREMDGLHRVAASQAGFCLVTVEREGCAYLVTFNDGATLLLQSDYDQAAFADACGLFSVPTPDGKDSIDNRCWPDCDLTDIWYCPDSYRDVAQDADSADE